MTHLALIAWLFCIMFETSQQLSFSYSGRFNGKQKWLWLGLGILFYIVELAMWMWFLTLLPFGIAIPMMGASYVTVALFSQYCFKETVDRQRWIGIAFILVGLVLIGGKGGG